MNNIESKSLFQKINIGKSYVSHFRNKIQFFSNQNFSGLIKILLEEIKTTKMKERT